ncbi:MAG: hypothetical protein JO185_02730 [Acidobacteriaceae bacterium]|nr:hypothetical protein [Acidobacteriaceae bacterium]
MSGNVDHAAVFFHTMSGSWHNQMRSVMSTESKDIRLDATVLQALQEGKPLDEMANQIVLTGLQADKLSMVQRVLAKGHRYGAASGLYEEEVVDVVRHHR